MAYWIKCTGTSARPLDVDDWQPSRRAWQPRARFDQRRFPRRPRIRKADRLITEDAAAELAQAGAKRAS